MQVIADETNIGTRLDVAIGEAMPQLSRAFIQKLCEQGKVTVQSKPTKPGYKVRAGDVITVDYDLAQLSVIPHIDLPILYEDDDCLVLNKPVGVLTHSKGAFNPEATVATFVRKHISEDGLMGERAGIVHRLDRATSGVIICAKTSAALSFLQKQFSQRKVKKTYNAVVRGTLDPAEAVIDMPIERNPKAPATFRVGPNGKSAVTHYKIIGSNATYSLLELKPETGRTHQLRVHLAHIGHPIVGDTLYNGAPADRLFLHARELEITLPNRERRTFTAPLPPEFSDIMK
ncbi:MAG TPA: RluA family pseudouridine synthase [Candidatus Saccharimonadales bacterium]|nr:RluA family pseudouridine synthase [Candidatus Saccharimonadales bacterium]